MRHKEVGIDQRSHIPAFQTGTQNPLKHLEQQVMAYFTDLKTIIRFPDLQLKTKLSFN